MADRPNRTPRTPEAEPPKVDTSEHTIAFVLEKDTKNTVRYSEKPPKGQPAKVGTIYIQKYVFGDEEPPKSIEVVVRF